MAGLIESEHESGGNHGSLRSAVERITKPLTTRPDVRGRRTRLLAWLLVSLLVLMAFALVLIAVVDAGADPRRGEYFGLIFALAVVFAAAYGLNASGHYTAAAWVTVIAAMMEPWASLALDPAILHGDLVPLMYVGVAVLLSSVLLSPWITVLVDGVQCAALMLVAVLNPATASFNWPSLITFVVITSALAILSSAIMQRDIAEIEDQARQLEESKDLLRELSIRDHLTGLYNRRYLEEQLERETIRSTRSNTAIAVLLFDVDHLKRVNDRLGHAAGDVVLKQVAESAAHLARGSDLACRCGGDEFVLILPGASQDVALQRAGQLREAVRDLHLEPAELHGENTTISIGVAVYPQHGETAEELLKAADAALYRAKRSGRDWVGVAQ
jgi:diguanylate cyclase (GGDEF)-like protein